MTKLQIVDHPLIQHKLTLMRDKATGTKDFRQMLDEIAMLLGYEVTRGFALKDKAIETPLEPMIGKELASKVTIVPILRAGVGMVDGLLKLLPTARVGHIGLYRDEETHNPVFYYCKLPQDIPETMVIVSDPMLATGGSAVDAINKLKEHGCKNIRMMCLVAAPEGVKRLSEEHPDVDIITAALDDHLNENAYIVPGLGDAGDRIYGTK
ncbi:MAG: uracil phosphoribosyltransferase [Firmicutes bacterium]|nr:uracil phosphoribosyltransferase [Bacillota bacterium]